MNDWEDVDSRDHEGAPFIDQLKRVLSLGHELFGSDVRVFARRIAQDDILVTVAGQDGCAVVHLTWSQLPQTAPWPRTTWFDSVELAKAALSES